MYSRQISVKKSPTQWTNKLFTWKHILKKLKLWTPNTMTTNRDINYVLVTHNLCALDLHAKIILRLHFSAKDQNKSRKSVLNKINHTTKKTKWLFNCRLNNSIPSDVPSWQNIIKKSKHRCNQWHKEVHVVSRDVFKIMWSISDEAFCEYSSA